MVSTNAFGMGIDKTQHRRYVIGDYVNAGLHSEAGELPGVGRAGRDPEQGPLADLIWNERDR